MTDLLNLLYILIALANLGLLYFTLHYSYKQKTNLALRWSIVPILLSGSVAVLYLLPPEWTLLPPFSRDALIWFALIAALGIMGFLILRDLEYYQPLPANTLKFWRYVYGLWLITLLIALFTYNAFDGWALSTSVTETTLVIWVGLLFSVGILVGVSLKHFSDAPMPMPEVANRTLFSMAIVVQYAASMGFASSGSNIIALPGAVGLLIALANLIYAFTRQHVIDIRQSAEAILRISLTTLILWGLVYLGLQVITQPDLSTAQTTLFALAVAGTIAGIYEPLRRIVLHLLRGDQHNIAVSTGKYSRDIAASTSLEEVLQATNHILHEAVHAQQATLLLVDRVSGKDNTLDFLAMIPSQHENKVEHGTIILTSPIYKRLAQDRTPLLQFDITYNPAFASIKPEAKTFFKHLNMNVYAPIISDNRLIGVIACGAKQNNRPFTKNDLSTLQIIGQQVGIVLRNARLIEDLRLLNENMKSVNQRLEDAKQELETLDSVRTDFVTIASHELRTPLAQFRGYTDMLDDLLNQSTQSLDERMRARVIDNLRKSIDRIDEIIAAMLDVSQLDTKAMDLRFVQTIPASLVRLAIAPHQEAVEQRNLKLITTGLSDLPYIQADMQRLVQALGNLIVNAIKFTPDGGTITIKGELIKTSSPKETDYIQISIHDTGIGIDESDMELIFQKFYRGFDPQLHSTGRYKFMGAGPGLGLTIAKGIIEGHGGKLWAKSEKRDTETLPGTTFYIKLPLAPPANARRVLPFEDTREMRRV